MNENRLVPGVSDADHYEELVEAMDTISINDNDRANIFSTLAAIVSLGNIDFEMKEGYSRATPTSPEAVATCAALMQVGWREGAAGGVGGSEGQVGWRKGGVWEGGVWGEGGEGRRDTACRSDYPVPGSEQR